MFPLLTVGVVALVGASLIGLYVYQVHGAEFFGWDAPYYIAKTKTLVEDGLPALIRTHGGLRIGYTLLSGLVAVVTPLSYLEVERYLPYFFIAAIAFSSGWFVLQMFKKTILASIAVVVSCSYFGLTDLALRNNSDNLFAYALLGILLNIFAAYFRERLSPRATFGLSACVLVIIGVTHLETYVLAGILCILMLVIFGIFMRAHLRAWWRLMRPLLASGATATVVVFALWGPRLFQVTDAVSVHAGSTPVDQAVTAYQLPISPSTIFSAINQPYALVWAVPLLIAAGIVLVRRLRQADRLSILVCAWTLAFVVAYVIFWIAQFDYNFFIRIVSLLPVGVLVAVGVAAVRTKGVIVQLALLVVTVVGFTSLLASHIRTSKSHAPEGLVEQIQEVAQFANRNWPPTEPVFISSTTTKHDTGEFATYTMWQNWIAASTPEHFSHPIALHFGKPTDLEKCKASQPVQSTQTEYFDVSAQSVATICDTYGTPKQYFILRAISKAYFDQLKPAGEIVAPGVLLVATTP